MPDVARAEAAIRELLLAVGADPEDASLRATPARVARAWIEELLDGTQQDPAQILSACASGSASELVMVRAIDFTGVCPHHLVPYQGKANVAYMPGDRIVGFGQLAQLVDCFAHRLSLQETVAGQVAQALVDHLGAIGAACLLDTEQGCLRTRGERRASARTISYAVVGTPAAQAQLRTMLVPKLARL